MISRNSIFLVSVYVLTHTQVTLAELPVYTIETVGFYDAEHTRADGYQFSDAYQLNSSGQVLGFSDRYNGSNTFLGDSVWLYDGISTINIGLTGTEHTRADGYQISDGYQLNEAGQVLGFSDRYNGGGAFLGQSIWLYDGINTINIGLTGTEYTRNDGYQLSAAFTLNEAGQVAGYSERYNGSSTSLGSSAWLYNNNSITLIGLTGIEHTRIDGFQDSTPTRLNEAGQVAGYSERYNSSDTFLGRSAWLYNGSSTINIGLTGDEHTRNDGYQHSTIIQLNEAGQVLGHSERYNDGVTYLGQTIWLNNGYSTSNIGLTGAEHTRNDGYKYSRSSLLNEAGQVAGYSERYNSSDTFLGRSAWLYNGSSTINIGLTGDEHARNDGYQSSTVNLLNEAGQVAGSSIRYNGNSLQGTSVWLYTGSSTINIGLTDAEHTRDDGYQSNGTLKLNEAGQVIGQSERFNGSNTSQGRSAWLYNGSSTINIGLTGDEHTRDDGFQVSSVYFLNESGQAAGFSSRFIGSTSSGQNAFFYDGLTDETYYHNFSLRTSDSFSYSSVQYLGEDGLMLGQYQLFNETDNSSLGFFAFGFTVEDGFFDLGLQIDYTLDSYGWNSLASIITSNESGQILGIGLLEGASGQAVFLASPSAVPVPPAIWLFSSGLIGLIGIARKNIKM